MRRLTVQILALALSFLGSGVLRSDATAESDQPHADPEQWDQRVAVTAAIEGSTTAPTGASSTVLDPERVGGTPSNLTAVVTQAPGVSRNGQGGQFQVFSIRGVSRHRVLNLVSGMRVNSERRAGASVSFVDPLLLDTVQVIRGPATTLHGSGALGGVVQVFPREHQGWSLRTGYDSRGDENYQVVGFGIDGWSVGFARRDADDADAADGSPRNSHFTQYSGTLGRRWQRGARTYDLLFIPTLGEDIGKPNTDFPERTTNYPRERHQMLRFSVESADSWNLRAYLHHHDLETDVVEQAVSRNRVLNDSLDYGFRWEREHELSARFSLSWGLQADGREDVNAEETRESLDPQNPQPIRTFNTLNDARQIESGAFVIAHWELDRTELEIGARASTIDQQNAGGADVDDATFNGFAGVVRRIGERFRLRAGLSSGLRFPNLSELFFSGTTGAGQVLGNPDLDPERALNAELSAHWTGQRWLFEGSVFHNDIDDYIERVNLGPELKSFVNLTSGTLRGVELQGMFLPSEGWMVTFGGHLIDGRDDGEGAPLADVPPDQLFVGFDHRKDVWSYGVRWTHMAEKNDAGSGEQPIPAAELLRADVARRLSDRWSVTLTGENLLDERYFASADDKATQAPGRSIGLHLVRALP